jgi:hypothetical protein
MPYSPDITDSRGIEASIREMVHKDFAIELDFSRHPKFDANPFYAAPNVDQISKDSDKVDYRRLSDQYAEAKYTLDQVVEAYKQQIAMQEDSKSLPIAIINEPALAISAAVECFRPASGDFPEPLVSRLWREGSRGMGQSLSRNTAHRAFSAGPQNLLRADVETQNLLEPAGDARAADALTRRSA